MPDFIAYWANFPSDVARGQRTLLHLFHNKQILKGVVAGDRLWLVACGKAIGHGQPERGFLVEEFLVQSAGRNIGETAGYKIALFQYVLHADPERTRIFEPPIDVDDLVRGHCTIRHRHIGSILQSPVSIDAAFSRVLYHLATPRP